MQLGMIRLGRMGASMVRRLLKRGDARVVHDAQPAAVSALSKYGATGAVWPKEMVSWLGLPRTVWLMVPTAVFAAIDEGVPVPVLSAALFAGFTSRGNADFANRVLCAMRYQFGGHVEKRLP